MKRKPHRKNVPPRMRCPERRLASSNAQLNSRDRPKASSRLHKLKMPVRGLYLLGGIGLLSFFVAVGLGFNYARMAFKAADYDKLQAENTNLKVQKKNLEVATQKLGEKINNLESIS